MASAKMVKEFEDLIAYLVAHEGKVDEAMAGQSKARPWCNLSGSELSTKATEKTEAAIHDVFKRDSANADYEQARTDKDAKSKQAAVAKIAGDFLAACERDKRAQWRTRLRMVAHATSRRFGNSKETGPLRRNTVDYLSRTFLKSQEVKPNG